MTTQTEAQRLITEWHDAWLTPISPTKFARAGGEMAEELRRLEAANAELLEALKGVTDEMLDVLYDSNNDRIPFDGDEFHERLEAGKAAIKKHGGQL